MKNLLPLFALSVISLATGVCFAQPRAQLSCESLKNHAPANTSIDLAERVSPDASGAVPGLRLDAFMRRAPKVSVPFCRVEGRIEQNIGFELWLPEPDSWSGRFLGAGVGGDAGVYNYFDLARGVNEGFAAATTDSGHKASEPTWMLDRTKEEDYAYRAEHLMTEVSKALVTAYYGQAPRHSYFIGCSGGGRQALKELQRFPADYDGIVAGAPGPDMPALSARHLKTAQIQAAHPESPLGDKEWRMVSDAAIAACDANDGVKDGIVTDPPTCTFDVSTLACKGESRVDCLTAGQIDVVRMIYAPLRDENGKQVDSGLLPGVRTRPGPAPSLVFELFGQGVHHDANWNANTFNMAADLKAVDVEMPEMRANDPHVTAFRDRGGKIIIYQGWMDPSVIAQQSVNYYESVVRTMGSASATLDFMRLLMVPGMYHCAGGRSTDSFGGDFQIGPEPDADHGCLSAIVRWVEKGIPPNKIIASGMLGADPVTRTGGVPFTRPLCPYPAVAHYKGAGDTNAAENFECAVPPAK